MSDLIQNNMTSHASVQSSEVVPSAQTASAVATALHSVANETPKIEESAVSESQVAKAVETLNQVLQERDVSLRFERNETLNRFIVEVVDRDTGERVLQVPNDEVVHAVENIDRLRGILFSGDA